MKRLTDSAAHAKSAEALYRLAFDRLCRNDPLVLAKGSRVTQNNVAREAGRDPSALKMDRYPDLIREIKLWQEAQIGKSKTNSERVKCLSREKYKALQERVRELKQDRDISQSLLLQAHAKILELSQRVIWLESHLDNKVVGIGTPASIIPAPER